MNGIHLRNVSAFGARGFPLQNSVQKDFPFRLPVFPDARWFFSLPQISMPGCYLCPQGSRMGNEPSTLLLYAGCVLIPENIPGALFFVVAPTLDAYVRLVRNR